MYIKAGIDFKIRNDLTCNNVEAVWVEISKLIGKSKTLICCYYRPPAAKAEYINDTIDMISKGMREGHELIMIGDFNIDYKLDESLANNTVKHIEDLFYLDQLVEEPTRVTTKSSTTIDLILTSSKESHLITKVHKISLSDHYLTITLLKEMSVKQVHKVVCLRDYKTFDPGKFRNLIRTNRT